MTTERFELPLRIVMRDPVPGVAIAMQKGAAAKASLTPPAVAGPDVMVFDFSVSAAEGGDDGRPRLLGPFVQGPPGARFVYLNVGVYAGDPASPWSRRVKVPLSGLDWPTIRALAPDQRLEAHIAGRGPDGAPACASVPLLGEGWRPVTS